VKVVRQVEAAESIEVIDAIKEEHKRSINQARRDWPELIDGNPNVPRISASKGRSKSAVSTTFQFLRSVVQECPTKADLEALLDEYAGQIEALDGEESRLFELAYNNREVALASPTPMTAGAFGA
jgi:hypothetical protein